MKRVTVGLLVLGGVLAAAVGGVMAKPAAVQQPGAVNKSAAPKAAPRAAKRPAPAAQTVQPVEGEPVKFCPVGGETYPAEITYCPEHGVELKARE